MGTKEIATRIEAAITEITEQAAEWLYTKKSQLKTTDKKELVRQKKRLEYQSVKNTKQNIVPLLSNKYKIDADYLIKIMEL